MLINSILPESKVNGLGNRAVVWVQGCSMNCEGCFNNSAHSYTGGTELTAEQIFMQLDCSVITGITVSGGEPFEQSFELEKLLKLAKANKLNTLVYTGYSFEKLCIEHNSTLKLCDYLIDGPYMKNIPSKCKWAGSGNQRFLKLVDGQIVNNLTENEEYSRSAEIMIDAAGKITVTGFIEV